jgi:NAD(P)-dependent dehydrogenase (short-subunit alcohol dehydrogenase family)
VSAEQRLEGKVALVTGASSGNGRAIALRLAHEGAAVVCADLQPEARRGSPGSDRPTHEAIVDLGGRARFALCDVSDGEQVRAAVETATAAFGRLDIAVANAGVNLEIRDIMEERFEVYERVIAINQHGVWWTCKHAARAMVARGAGGRLIAIASVAGLAGLPAGAAYGASKGAVVQIVRTLALQLAPHGITVNAICPGWVRTAMTRETQSDPERLERVVAQHPLGRLGEPEDVAGAAFFLASDDASWVTGVALPVDGGYTAV